MRNARYADTRNITLLSGAQKLYRSPDRCYSFRGKFRRETFERYPDTQWLPRVSVYLCAVPWRYRSRIAGVVAVQSIFSVDLSFVRLTVSRESNSLKTRRAISTSLVSIPTVSRLLA